ncbi:hypothetical protein [Kribbella sp. NPDC049227]|uniref:hypothetical protein n=1 Tax=Kribbella sp. NPDC049227 TaxID=3364113 RepID=UPI00372132EE
MGEAEDRDSVGIQQEPLPGGSGDEGKRRDFRLMGFAASLALLVMLATPWLTTWDNNGKNPTRIYTAISMIELQHGVDGPRSPMGGAGTLLFVVYLLLTLACLVFPATIVAVVCSCLGPVVTVVIMMMKPDSDALLSGVVSHVDWTGAPTVAVAVWLVAAFVAAAGWSARRT